MKTLQFWNGRGNQYKHEHVYIAAYTKKQAIELLEKYSGFRGCRGEIENYFSKCWGTVMEDYARQRQLNECGLWVTTNLDKVIKRII